MLATGLTPLQKPPNTYKEILSFLKGEGISTVKPKDKLLNLEPEKEKVGSTEGMFVGREDG